MLKKFLQRQGYTVTAIRSSAEALRIFQENPQRFDAVITDQTMPQMTGQELAVNLLEIQPELPIILYTGYSHQVDKESAEAAGIRAFLNKPIAIGDLANTLRQIFEHQT